MSIDDYDLVATVAKTLGWVPNQEWMTPFQQSAQAHIWRQACEVIDDLRDLGAVR